IPSGEIKVHIEVLSVLWGNRLPIRTVRCRCLGQGSPGRNKTHGPWSAGIPIWQLFKGLGGKKGLKTKQKRPNPNPTQTRPEPDLDPIQTRSRPDQVQALTSPPTIVDRWSCGGQRWSSGSQRWFATGGGWTNWNVTRHHGTATRFRKSVRGSEITRFKVQKFSTRFRKKSILEAEVAQDDWWIKNITAVMMRY
nr:hypothetical protein [Tanacetum cinerariifolium]